MIDYELIRSKRKTLALYVRQDGAVEVRAPLRTKATYIEDFITRKQDWILNSQKKILERNASRKIIELTAKEEADYKFQAKEYIKLKCQFFSSRMGIRHGNIKVNSAKSRWGSCNRKGDINFTYRLIFVPEELIDYVVVHELAHIRELNHSADFWSIVEQAMPDYKLRRKRLKEFQYRFEIEVNK